MFTENLHNILLEIFRLAHYASLPPEYVETLSPLERNLYWAYWLNDQKERNKEPGQYDVMDDNIPQGINMQGIM